MWQEAKNYYHFLQAFLSAVLFDFPSGKLVVIGVTGTDGKTTTVNMIYHILKSTGRKVSMISSVNAQIGTLKYDTGFHVSTPGPYQIQKYLKRAVDEGSDYFVLEATSHGLHQNRLAFVDFKVGVLTNITHEHLDYHKSWDKYAQSKLILLEKSDVKIVNIDDSSYDFLKTKLHGKILTYSLSKKSDFNLNNFKVLLKIDGHYNLSNALAACAVASFFKIPKDQILGALKKFKGVKGRLEKVDLGQKFDVYIDFAHTPNGLENVLTTLKFKTQKGKRLIAVFGAAGGRDRLKRPKMGKVATEIANIVVLTSEDPRKENPQKICQEIAAGMKGKKLNKDFYIIIDRQKAIDFAIQIARAQDTVGLFGKGHEQSMNVNGKESPWNEFEAVKKAIKDLNGK